jgi:tape measure domain-containing protein
MIVRELLTRIGYVVDRRELSTAERAFKRLKQLSFAIGAAGVAGAALLTDQYTVLQNKLKNVTDDQESLNGATQRLFEIANETRQGVGETVTSFQRFRLALKQINATEEETFRLTETVAKSLTLSGASADESSAALLQLSQAFNKGKLDGDEFRTVMELMPTAADAIAAQLGVARGELLRLAPTGAITAEVMLRAFQKASKSIDKGFAETVPTIGQSFVVLRNQTTKFFGELESLTGLARTFSRVLIQVSSALGEAARFFRENSRMLGILGGVLTAVATPAVLAYAAAWVTANAATIAAIAIPALIAAAVVAAGAAIALVIEDIFVFVSGGKSAIGELFASFSEAAQEPGAHWMVRTLEAILFGIKETIMFVDELFRGFFDAAANAGGIGELLHGALVAPFTEALASAQSFFGSVRRGLNAISFGAIGGSSPSNSPVPGLAAVAGAGASGVNQTVGGNTINLNLTNESGQPIEGSIERGVSLLRESQDAERRETARVLATAGAGVR